MKFSILIISEGTVRVEKGHTGSFKETDNVLNFFSKILN